MKEDFEYERCGVANIFLASEPLTGKRYVEVTERKTKRDWTNFIRQIADDWYNDDRADDIGVEVWIYDDHGQPVFYWLKTTANTIRYPDDNNIDSIFYPLGSVSPGPVHTAIG